MSENVMNSPEIDEAEMLLPWYATGELSEQDMQVVDAWLADHPDAADRLESVREEMHLTIEGNEAIKAPGVAGLNRLMADIEAEGDARVQSAGLFERIGAFLGSLSPQAMGIATAACLGLLVAQAAVIGTLVGDGQGEFKPVTGGEIMPAGPIATVQFQDAAPAMAISALLNETGGKIVNGPKIGGSYEIGFPRDHGSRCDGRKPEAAPGCGEGSLP